jgi:hypothetical protein
LEDCTFGKYRKLANANSMKYEGDLITLVPLLFFDGFGAKNVFGGVAAYSTTARDEVMLLTAVSSILQ